MEHSVGYATIMLSLVDGCVGFPNCLLLQIMQGTSLSMYPDKISQAYMFPAVGLLSLKGCMCFFVHAFSVLIIKNDYTVWTWENIFLNTDFLGPTPDLLNLQFLRVFFRNLYLMKCSFQGVSDAPGSLTSM